jgi:REP element-mobilizing transposase RayT
MSRPLRIQYPGAYYHVTSRGNEQKDIFKSDRDREKFLDYLQGSAQRYGAMIHCYCLMRNHYHLLLETPGGNLSQIMQHINGSYTTYFNIKRKRAGHLFQGRYHAILVDADAYALELSRYIHLNPVRARAAQRPEEYVWSSYIHYLDGRAAPAWLQTETILAYLTPGELGARACYRTFVEDKLGRADQSPLKEVWAGTLLGGEAFIEMVRGKHLTKDAHDRNLPAQRTLQSQRTIEQISRTVARHVSDETLARKICIQLCHRSSGEKLRSLGERFGVSESGITQVSRRLAGEAKKDVALRRLIETIENDLGLYNV